MLWRVSALKCSIFQKIDFSRFSIDRTCCSIDRNCDKKLGLNPPGSIDLGSIKCDFWSIESNFRPIENHSESFFFLNKLFHVFFTFSNFSKSFFFFLSLSLFDRSKFKSNFCHFLSKFFSRFLSYSANKTFIDLYTLSFLVFSLFSCILR